MTQPRRAARARPSRMPEGFLVRVPDQFDGSFVTAKPNPGDFDACWDLTCVDPTRLDPELLDFDNRRAAQKAKYGGELFPAQFQAETIFPYRMVRVPDRPFWNSFRSTKPLVKPKASSFST